METPQPQGIPYDVLVRIEQGAIVADGLADEGDAPAALAEYRRLLTLLDDCEPTADVAFTKARLLRVVGNIDYRGGDLGEALDAFRVGVDLLDTTADAQMGPHGRPLWVSTAVGLFVDYAEALHKVSDLGTAHALLDRADALLAEIADPSAATLSADVRASLFVAAGDFARAEALLAAAIPDADPNLVGRLHVGLGSVYAITGRLDDAEDEYRRAADAFDASDWTTASAELDVELGDLAHRRGDLDAAARMYEDAARGFAEAGREGDVAICRLSLAEIAISRGDDSADGLLAEALRRFTALGMTMPAADTMLLMARRAFERLDVHTAVHYVTTARSTFQEAGVKERCAQTDYMSALAIEAFLDSEDFELPERQAIDEALALALPAALYLESIRYDFPSSAARSQWMGIATSAMNLAFRLAVRRDDPGLMFELVEFRCAGASLASSPPVEPPASERLPETMPHPDDDRAHTLGRALPDVASEAGLRVGPPPGVLMSPGHGRTALFEYIDVARRRFEVDVVTDERIPSW